MVPAFLAGALVIAAAAGGVGIGHVVWPGTQTASGNPVEVSSGSASGSGGGDGSSGSTGGSGSTGSPGSTSTGGSGGTNGSSTNGSGTNGGGSAGDGSDGSGSNGNSWPPGIAPGNGDGTWPGGNLPGGGNGNGTNGSGTTGGITSAPGAPSDISSILSKVDDAVVDINVTFDYQQARGAGTGIVLTSTGEVLTNNHVINGATDISVTDIGNGKTYDATVIGYDVTHDVALLQLSDASGLATATLGKSSTVAAGDPVVGIGNAGGLGGTPSAAGGSVTAVNRSISVSDEMYGTTTTLSGLIEVNADIQSGDSGGPLVTAVGAVIGMDTAASAGRSRAATGSDGYAIPIDTAMKVVSQIRSGTGTATIHVGATAALGVLVSSGDQSGSSEQGNAESATGAVVEGVVDGGAAAKAKLVAGDVITSLGGHAVKSSADLSTLMAGYRPGQSVSLGWTDASGAAHSATVTLGTGPAA